MKTNEPLFKDDELVERFDDNWQETDGWKRLPVPWPEDLQFALVRAIQEERAGVTICFGDQADPIGSGVLVRGTKGYGILTAGHVCGAFKHRLKNYKGNFFLRCISQGPREPIRPGEKESQVLKPFNTVEASEVHDSVSHVPDYGCVVLPELDGRAMSSWGTFINLAEGQAHARGWGVQAAIIMHGLLSYI